MKATILVALTLCSSYPLTAWNNTGHKAVAFIAYSNLTPRARARVDQLLAAHPMFDAFSQTADPAADHVARIAFVNFATWPDAIRSNDDFVDTPRMDAQCHALGVAGEGGPVLPGFPDMQRHQDWHFVDTPFSPDHTPTHPSCAPNAQLQLEAFIQALHDARVPDAVKTFELPWLLHLAGDVHQPLHATSRFSHAFPDGDRGGNSVKLFHSTNLHTFWDDVAGTSASEDFIARLATGIMDAFPRTQAADVLTPATWVHESFTLAKSTVYTFTGTGTADDQVQLTDPYKVQARLAARQQIALAGYRLAAVLNHTF